MCLRPGLDTLKKKEISCPCRQSNYETSHIQPVANHCTDCTVPDPVIRGNRYQVWSPLFSILCFFWVFLVSSRLNWTLAHPPRPGGLVPSRAHVCLVWCNRAAGLIHVQKQQSPLRVERWHAEAVTVTNTTTMPFAPSQLCGHKSRICAAYPFVFGGGRGGVKFKTLWAGCGINRTTHNVHSAELNLVPSTGWELPHISPTSSSYALES